MLTRCMEAAPAEQTMSLTDWRQLYADRFENVPVLITGGAGFIGSHLSEALATLGANVRVLDDFSGSDMRSLRSLPEALQQRIEVIEGSILDRKTVDGAVSGSRFIFHQAALGSVPRSLEMPEHFTHVNIIGTQNVLEAARAAEVKRVMFAASSSAYGNSEVLPKHEMMPSQPLSPYAATKCACEHLIRAYANSFGVDGMSLRYFNIFGPRQNANSAYAAVIAAFAAALAQGKPPVIHGDGEQSRDFTYVDNAVHANLLAATREQPLLGQVANVACGRRITINQLAERMKQDFDQPDLKPTYTETRGGDVMHSLADLARARDLLDYEPVVDFEQGLDKTVDWYRRDIAASSAG